VGIRRQGRLVGRDWAVERIRNWLGSTEPALLITGSPGIGKTALVSGLARTRVHAIHLCRSHVTASTDPVRMLAGLAYQLSRSVPGYTVRSAPWHRAETDQRPQRAAQLVLDASTADAAYDQVLRYPLTALASGGPDRRDVVVVIDGLDEADSGASLSPLADLLAQRCAMPNTGLRLLLTSRPGTTADRLQGVPTFDLTVDAPPGADDVRAYVDTVCGLPARHWNAIAAAAGGSHLYAEVAMRLAAAGQRAVLAAGPPPGLTALYDWALADLGGPESLARRMLALLARARDKGLTANQIAAVLGESRDRIEAALSRCSHLLSGSRWVRVHHRCLAEHIAASEADTSAADWAIASALRQRLAGGGQGGGRGGHGGGRGGHGVGRRGGRAEPYAARNLLVHLSDAGSAAADQAMADHLADPQFLTTALTTVGVDDLLSAWAYLRRRRRPLTDEAEAFGIILRGQAGTLRRAGEEGDATLATQQLLYEAATIGETPFARRLAAHLGDAGILTLWATQDSPMRFLPKAARGHATQVTQIMVTADGTRAVSASVDGTPHVWRLASGRVAQTMPKTGRVTALYPTPDASQVVAATADGHAQVWDTERGESVQQGRGTRIATVSAFAVSPGGTRAISGDLDGDVTVWDLTTGEPDLRLPCRASLVTAVAITPDGRAAAAAGGGRVVVWDLAAGGAPVARLVHPGPVSALALTPAADHVLVGGDTLTVYAVTGTGTAEPAHRLITHHHVTALAVNPAMPAYALLGTALGQVAYIRLPGTSPSASTG
jgi:hypothetical protein